MKKQSNVLSSHAAAFRGFLFSLPFIFTNFVVSLRIEPIYSFLGSFPSVRNSSFLPLILLLLFPVGAFIAIKPMLRKKKFYMANTMVALFLIVVFVVLFAVLGQELYRCDVLQIPNCD
jgi:hypothetical protein